MNHTNIATVFHADSTEDGIPYFTMEYINGDHITDYCNERKMNVRQRLQLFCDVCEGVLHAHQKGIIHRDLKPSNILVTHQNQRPVPKIIDFGIAKALDVSMFGSQVETLRGAFIGTPAYMSPEQVFKGVGTTDTRNDIYSLGAVLYEVLTGKTILNSETI